MNFLLALTDKTRSGYLRKTNETIVKTDQNHPQQTIVQLLPKQSKQNVEGHGNENFTLNANPNLPQPSNINMHELPPTSQSEVKSNQNANINRGQIHPTSPPIEKGNAYPGKFAEV